jgi:hypothetical protein
MADTINRKHEKAILKVIEGNPVYTFQDIFVFYKACSRQTAYAHGLDKSDTIKEALYANKRTAVTTMLDKWVKSDNATLQLAAMRIIGDAEERRSLNQQYIDHTSGGKPIINLTDGTKG